jgi:hypothetical protein
MYRSTKTRNNSWARSSKVSHVLLLAICAGCDKLDLGSRSDRTLATS